MVDDDTIIGYTGLFAVSDDYNGTTQILTFGSQSGIGDTMDTVIPIEVDICMEMTETINVEGNITEPRASFPLPQTVISIQDEDSM